MKKTKQPSFGGALLADNARPQNSGKIDLHGVFTMMHAWGFPALRAWSLVINVYDLPKKQSTLIISIKRKGSNQIDTLATADINSKETDNAISLNLKLGYRFEKEGDYEIICSVKDFSSKLKVPVRIRTREWPEFTKEELKILEKNKAHLPFKVSAQVRCANCDRHYAFEEKLLDSEPSSEGTIPFPESGAHECESCGHQMKLKDIQGQIRASIKDNLINYLNMSRNV